MMVLICHSNDEITLFIILIKGYWDHRPLIKLVFSVEKKDLELVFFTIVYNFDMNKNTIVQKSYSKSFFSKEKTIVTDL